MKILYDSYLFDASAQTVVFQGHVSGSLEQRRILSIINVVEGVIIYNLLDPNKGGTIIPDAGGDILTLEYDTTSMSDTDELHIAFEDGVYPASQDDIGGIQSVLPASLGQKIKAQSLPVTIASDQDALPVSIDSIDLPTGASTSAKQDNEIALLTSIEGKDFSSETTLALIKAKTDNLDIAVSALRDALRGAGSKTLTDLETDLAAIKTAVETIDNFISGTKGLVTEDNSAAIKTAVETIDNFISGSRGLVTEDNSAAIKTAVEVIDNFISGSRGLVTEDNSAAILATSGATADAIVAAGAAGSISAKLRRVTQGLEDLKTLIVLAAGTAIIGKVGIDQTTPGTTNGVQVNAALPAGTNLIGKVAAQHSTSAMSNGTTDVTPKFAKIDRATNADGAAVVSLVSAKKIRVLTLTMVSAGTVSVKWQSSTSNSTGAGSNTDLTGLMSLVANTGMADVFSPVGLFETVAGEALKLNLNAAVQVSGYLTYLEI